MDETVPPTIGSETAADSASDAGPPTIAPDDWRTIDTGIGPDSSFLPATFAPADWSAIAGPNALPSLPGYDLLRELGRGGMGVVYHALQQGLNRPVALKMILAGAFAQPAQRLRFLSEAEAVAKLDHPNIVRIHEFGQHDGHPFFAMEYVDGDGLDRQLRGAPMSPRRAAELVARMARAMHHAHGKGVVHRDLKPANVLVTGLGEPKITDFGLAKHGDAAMTATGEVIGTPSYMAPEQATGHVHGIGPAADIYSLGAILYEALTGRPPFRGATLLDTLELVRTQEPVAPHVLQPKLPRDLDTIALKCLAKDPARRYTTAGELADDLDRFLEGSPIRARPAGSIEKAIKWGRRRPTAAALVGAAAALGIALVGFSFQLRRERDNAREQERRAVLAKDVADRRLVRLHVATGTNALGVDDPWSALLWYAHAWATDRPDSGQESSHRLRLASVLARLPRLERLLFHDRAVLDVAFSPDRRLLVARTAEAVQLWELDRERPIGGPLRHGGRLRAMALSPDGSAVATGGDDGTARLWSTATGAPLGAPLAHPGGVMAVAFSPDGSRLATAAADGVVRSWRVDNGQPLPMQIKLAGAYALRFSPDGSRLAVAHADGRASLRDAANGRPIRADLPHVGPEFDPDITWRLGPEFTPDGRLLLTTARGRLDLTDAADGRPVRTIDTGMTGHGVRFLVPSPDSTAVLVHSLSTAKVIRLADGQTVAELDHPRESIIGCWAGRSDRVVTASTNGLIHVWQLPADGGEPAEGRQFRQVGTITRLIFDAPAGRVVVAGTDGTVRAWSIDAEPPAAQPYDFADGRADQAWLRGGTAGFIRVDPEDERRRQSFSPDGSLAVRFGDGGAARVVSRVSADEAGLTLDHGGAVTFARFSPDGRRVLTGEGRTVRAWDAGTGRAIGPTVGLDGPLTQVWMSTDGRRALAVADRPGDAAAPETVLAWDVDSGRVLLGPLRQPDLGVTPADANVPGANALLRCAIAPDGRRVALAGGSYGQALIFDLDAGTRYRAVGNRGYVWSVEFSPDGGRIVSACSDTTARVFDAATGAAVGPVLRHPTFVRDAAYSPDGRRIATLASGGAVQVWDAATGDPLGPPLEAARCTRGRVWFGRDGRRVLRLAPGDRVVQWDLPTFPAPGEDVPALVDLLTGQHVDAADSIDLLHEADVLARVSAYRAAWARRSGTGTDR